MRTNDQKVRSRRSDRSVPDDALPELYARYSAGATYSELAREFAPVWGGSPESIAVSIAMEFKRRGWPTRGRSGVAASACSECGCAPHERTPGCDLCSKRHWRRKRRGLSHLAADAVACQSCGASIDSVNPGCRTCRVRANARRYRQRQKEGTVVTPEWRKGR